MHDWTFSRSFKKATAWTRYLGCWMKARNAPLPNPPGWEPASPDLYELQALEPRVLLSASDPTVAGGAALMMSQETPLNSQAVAALK